MPHFQEFLSPEQAERFNAPPDIVVPEEIRLFMPSELSSENRGMPRACRPGLAEMEMRLREAECWESLESLRSGLRTRSAALHFQVQNVSGQTSVTRAEGIQRRYVYIFFILSLLLIVLVSLSISTSPSSDIVGRAMRCIASKDTETGRTYFVSWRRSMSMDSMSACSPRRSKRKRTTFGRGVCSLWVKRVPSQ